MVDIVVGFVVGTAVGIVVGIVVAAAVDIEVRLMAVGAAFVKYSPDRLYKGVARYLYSFLGSFVFLK